VLNGLPKWAKFRRLVGKAFCVSCNRKLQTSGRPIFWPLVDSCHMELNGCDSK
jgi:hypothetical protein